MPLKNKLLPDMLIRKMPFGPRRTICRHMDIDSNTNNWEALAGSIIDPRTNSNRYSMNDIENFRLELRKGNSITEAVLRDWGTQETTVEQLLEVLFELGRHDVISDIMPEYLEPKTVEIASNPHASFEIVGEHGEPPIGKDVDDVTTSSIEKGIADVKIDNTTSQLTPSQSSTAEQPQGTTTVVKSSETVQIMLKASEEGVMDICYFSLKTITSNFNERRKLGEGGFGSVYLGRLPKNGEDVAVKVLKEKEEKHKSQFKNELKHLSSLSHKNILPPMGYSFDGPAYCLVYHFMPNGSLEDCLRNSTPDKCLPWKLRLSIATDIALGIEYLHSKHIIHRDIKSANVLLDANFVGKVADFGLVRNIGNKTHVTKVIIGSPVYMCREAFQGDVSPTVDVYSYGVILLELITGLPASEVPETQEDIITYCQTKVDVCRDELYSIIDKSLVEYCTADLDSLYKLAEDCLEHRKVKRITMERLLSEIKQISKYEG
ncbi:interleukin-1 receptor-associated kinase 4-like [Antedon mediterranea]|uniref:interleukin-1 receptor-associated kinase 4-like n=1 Tax=Antedon mediterranea TaxID=105859 RepID=UPI003AF7CB2A